jgi:hypothetical protein
VTSPIASDNPLASLLGYRYATQLRHHCLGTRLPPHVIPADSAQQHQQVLPHLDQEEGPDLFTDGSCVPCLPGVICCAVMMSLEGGRTAPGWAWHRSHSLQHHWGHHLMGMQFQRLERTIWMLRWVRDDLDKLVDQSNTAA